MDLNNNKNAEIEKQICNNNNNSTQILNSEINTLTTDNDNYEKLSSVLNLNEEKEQRVTCNKLIIKITLKNKTEVKFVNLYEYFTK